MRIAIAASEAAPFVKTGGLGDVMQALPLELSRIAHNEISVFLPYYGMIKYGGGWDMEFLGSFEVQMAWRREYVGVLRLKSRRKKLRIYFIDNEHYFCRGGIYGEPDDGERFAYFSKAVLAAIGFLDVRPDVIHCNDWQTALIPLLLKTEYHESLPDVRSVFTIHNIEYQGKAGLDFNREVLGLAPECDGILRFDGCDNFMKAAIVTADRVNTVSKTYAQELQYIYYAHGLADVVREKGAYFSGIFGTEKGSSLRATGANPHMARAQGINTNSNIVLGLMVSNGFVALSGALLAQYQGSSDINMGRGAIVIGLAAVIIGEVIFGKLFMNFGLKLLAVSIGAIIYYIVLQVVLQLGLNTNDLKLITALIVAVFLAIPYWKSRMFRRKVQPQSAKNGGNGHA